MELMQKYVKSDNAVGIDDLRRWPSNSDAVGFLSETTSAPSAKSLMKVCEVLSCAIFLTPPASIDTAPVAQERAQRAHILRANFNASLL